MPLVWVSISGHGFGHAAQLVPVLNELGKCVSDLRVILRTTVPQIFFQETLEVPWEYLLSQQDIGCIQENPLHIDIPGTWQAYREFHLSWDRRMREEVHAIRFARPTIVLSNISHLGIASGVNAGCPTVALASLSWDQILEEYISDGCAQQRMIVEHIRQAYWGVRMLLRPFPGIVMPAFPLVTDVGPILLPPVRSRGVLRDRLKLEPHERLVLIAFGGIPVSSLPLEQLEGLKGFVFLISGEINVEGYTRLVSTHSLDLPFRQILAEADVLLTKPGYATIVEAVRLHLPVVYVRRYNFADEQPLVDFIHQYGRAKELSLDEFQAGQWLQALEEVQVLPSPDTAMPAEGTHEAVEHLLEFFE